MDYRKIVFFASLLQATHSKDAIGKLKNADQECRTLSGRNLYSDTGKIEWDLPAGSSGIADYQFQTFDRQGNPGYQNIGIWITKFKSGYGVEPHLVYTRGSQSDSIQVTNSGIYFYVDPYGSADDKGSAYGGSWKLKVCIKKATEECRTVSGRNLYSDTGKIE